MRNLLYGLLVGFLLLSVPPHSGDVPYPVVALSKTVSPASTSAGAAVTYRITLSNSGDVAANDVRVSDTLPAGFSYRSSTTRVYRNSVLISSADPAVNGRVLTWNLQQVPARRADSFYGINTFVQEACQINTIVWQLDRTRELMGYHGLAKQLLYGVSNTTGGPQPCWTGFINAAYDRGLNVLVRLAGLHDGNNWLKPQADGPGNYTSAAQAFKRVVAGLPRNLALNGTPNRIVVGLARSGEVALLDATSGVEVARTALGGWGNPQGLAVDPARGELLISDADGLQRFALQDGAYKGRLAGPAAAPVFGLVLDGDRVVGGSRLAADERLFVQALL